MAFWAYSNCLNPLIITNSASIPASLIRLINSNPSYPGIRISDITMSGSFVMIISNASIPVYAIPTISISKAFQSNNCEIREQIIFSSSAITTFNISTPDLS